SKSILNSGIGSWLLRYRFMDTSDVPIATAPSSLEIPRSLKADFGRSPGVSNFGSFFSILAKYMCKLNQNDRI
ncbi:hypothetical protein, partial [Leptospira inadai]|uniref:hypothetical protein n=1 Tax=Leptospira inadai TaxID=29506 RepID=UPI0015E1ABDC